jgi:hypothetical protein
MLLAALVELLDGPVLLRISAPADEGASLDEDGPLAAIRLSALRHREALAPAAGGSERPAS